MKRKIGACVFLFIFILISFFSLYVTFDGITYMRSFVKVKVIDIKQETKTTLTYFPGDLGYYQVNRLTINHTNIHGNSTLLSYITNICYVNDEICEIKYTNLKSIYLNNINDHIRMSNSDIVLVLLLIVLAVMTIILLVVFVVVFYDIVK